MTRLAVIPPGTWPPRMGAELSAGYCGEVSAEAFLRAVARGEYPQPRVKRGRRQIWWTEDLDQAIKPSQPQEADTATAEDVLQDLLPCLARSRAS